MYFYFLIEHQLYCQLDSALLLEQQPADHLAVGAKGCDSSIEQSLISQAVPQLLPISSAAGPMLKTTARRYRASPVRDTLS